MKSSWIYPIPDHRKSVYEFYQLAFDKNGCPMKKTADGLLFHPLYGSYLIQDFYICYEATKQFKYIDIAENIAHECTKKLTEFKNALVYWYTPESKLSSVPFTFYSALSQVHYMYSLSLLYTITHNKKYRDTIAQLYNSLLIPAKEKGVLLNFSWGSIIEEYYSEPPLFTLNGFITAIKLILRSFKALIDCGINDVNDFTQKLLSGLEHILPLYDAEFVYNTRYNLSGFTRIRIVFDKPVNTIVNNFSVEIPNVGIFNGSSMNQKSNRWNNYIERHEKKAFTI